MWHKLSEPFKNFGVTTALLYVCQRVLARLPVNLTVMKYHLVAQPVPPEPKRRRPHKLSITQIPPEQYRDHWFPRPRAAIEARYAQGAVCFVAFDNDEPLACLWLKAQGGFNEDTIRSRFEPTPVDHTAWDFDVYVHPAHRLGRTFLHLWTHAFDWMRERDIRWTMSRIDAFNLASINSHRRLGAQITGHVIYWTWGNWQLTLSSQRPRWNLSRSAVPVYRVNTPEH